MKNLKNIFIYTLSLITIAFLALAPIANANFFGPGNLGGGFFGGGGLTWEGNILTLDNLVFAGRACPTCYSTSDGNDINVNRWDDESGNTYDPIAGSSASYPDYNQDALGSGKAGFEFNGTDNKLQWIGSAASFNHFEADDEVSMCWYGSFDLIGSGHVGIFEVGNGGLNTGAQAYIHGTSDNLMPRAFHSSGWVNREMNVTSSDGGIHSWCYIYDYPNENVIVYRDGVDLGGTVNKSSPSGQVPVDWDTISFGSPHTSFDFNGVIGMAIITSDILNPAEVQLFHYVASSGVYSADLSNPRWVIVGDSLSVDPASGGQDPAWGAILQTNNSGITVINEAIAGQTLNTIDGAYASQIGANYKSGAVSNNLIIFGGTNDIATGRTPAQVKASIDSIVSQATTTGYDNIYVMTILDRNPNTYDSDISTANGLITGGSGYTVIDIASVTNLLDGSNTTYFYDGVHLEELGHVEVHSETASVTGLSHNVIPLRRNQLMVA